MNSKAIEVFERLAVDTWERIKFGEELDCRQSEETITDINLLEIKRAALANILVSKSNKDDEGLTGLDWEWWIGSNSTGWWRYAVQAKKLFPNGKYNKLRHKVGNDYQIDILEKYSKANNCIPLYCFYNFLEDPQLSQYWNCNLNYEEKQLGCTVVPIDTVRVAFGKRADKSFKALHSDSRSIPWRCLIKCPNIGTPHFTNSVHPLACSGYEEVRPYQINLSNLQSDFLFNSELYDKNIEIMPKRILIINTFSD
ncbi:DUF6615 family protein [Brevibacillus sp. 179-C9.3 HS]|uniref:DUF6615 family protein n=1 Tax=unclassified Brevibacillus TaxID=2684853 RepID=UPI00399F121C